MVRPCNYLLLSIFTQSYSTSSLFLITLNTYKACKKPLFWIYIFQIIFICLIIPTESKEAIDFFLIKDIFKNKVNGSIIRIFCLFFTLLTFGNSYVLSTTNFIYLFWNTSFINICLLFELIPFVFFCHT